MSAYIVDDKTINLIVAALKTANQNGGWNKPYCSPKNEALQFESPAEFGRTLYGMNLNAVEQRYPDTVGNPDRLPGPCDEDGKHTPYKFQSVIPPQPVQFLKFLSCLMYQCSEGDVDELPLYKALREYESILALHIVQNSKAYDEAKWE